MNIEQELIKVANSLKIALSKYYKFSNGYLFVGRPQGWPTLSVIKQNDDTFNIYKFNSKNDVLKLLSKMSNQQLEQLGKSFDFSDREMNLLFSNYSYYIQNIVNRFEGFVISFFMRNESNLTSSKVLSDFLLRSYYLNISKEKLYTYMLTKQKLHPKDFVDMFGQVDLKEDENKNFNYKKWNVEVIDGVKIDGVAIRNLLDDIEIKLNKIGQQQLLYGKIYFVKTISGGTLADYVFSSDEIRVKTFKRADDQIIKTMCHELGHRLYDKFIKDKRVILLKFLDETKKGKSFNYFKVIPGEKIKSPENNIYTIESDGYKILYMSKETTNKKVKYKMKKSELYKFEFLDRKVEKEESIWFPTQYSRKDEQEWFSEIFAFYCMGLLKQPVVDWIKGII